MPLKLVKQYWLPIILTLLCASINIFSSDKQLVENMYSTNWYASFSTFYRSIFAWLPFSVGDILYGLAFLFLIFRFIKFCKKIFSKEKRKIYIRNWKKNIIQFYIKIACIYILFNILWGINYNRVGIAAQLNLKIEKYTLEELQAINFILVQKINENKLVLQAKNENSINSNSLFLRTKTAYDSASNKYPFLHYQNKSVKKSIFAWLCNYVQIDGYYNPFTGEATVNTTVPAFTQPFTTCHEVAHQLGYAKEMEANFVGYIAATSSNDDYFKYSTYTDLFTYANNTLRIADSTSAFEYRKLLLPTVIVDFKERRKFAKDHVGKLEPFFRTLYGIFLKQNEQPMGILSYDEVTAFIIAYHKKFNEL